jgi:hypothetical protein
MHVVVRGQCVIFKASSVIGGNCGGFAVVTLLFSQSRDECALMVAPSIYATSNNYSRPSETYYTQRCTLDQNTSMTELYCIGNYPNCRLIVYPTVLNIQNGGYLQDALLLEELTALLGSGRFKKLLKQLRALCPSLRAAAHEH